MKISRIIRDNPASPRVAAGAGRHNTRPAGNLYPCGTAAERKPGTTHIAIVQQNLAPRLHVNRN